jgi:hypothetical protein
MLTRPTHALLVLGLVLAALGVGGCGDHHAARRSAGSAAAFPRVLALQLAAESDDVAHQLAVGAPCSALTAAARLRQQTIQAIGAGRVPAAFRRTLRSTTADLARRIRCVATTPSPRARPIPPSEQHGHGNNGKHKGHGKHNGNQDEGD